MRRTICRCSICIVLLLTGCSLTNKWTSSNAKRAPSSTEPVAGIASVGSPDLQATKKVDPVKLHLAYATWHEQTGNYAEARKSYAMVLEKSRKEVDAMLGLARIDRVYGRDAEADAQLKKTLKCHPKNPKVLVAIGEVHAARQEWPQALEKMRAAHSLAPYDNIYQYHLAVVEARSGDIPPALEHFIRSVGEAQAYYNLGYILNEQGRTTEAETHLVKALALKPDLKQAETVLASIRSGRATDDVVPASFSRNE